MFDFVSFQEHSVEFVKILITLQRMTMNRMQPSIYYVSHTYSYLFFYFILYVGSV